ncbi:hypothetical protein Tco_0137922 [Tanacetum coccineum]
MEEMQKSKNKESDYGDTKMPEKQSEKNIEDDDDIYKDQGVLNAFSVVEKNSFVNPYPEIGKTKGSIKPLSPMKKTTRAKAIAKKTKKNKDVQKKQKIYRQQKKQQQHLNLHQQEEPKEMQQDV